MMAEKEPVPSPENLQCPLCLEIFEVATLLSCGHSFCRKCLKDYDELHQELDHMVCPLCRGVTEFHEGRVDSLPYNIAINGLVDEFNGREGGLLSLLESQQKCTSCSEGQAAVSFCDKCGIYMCDICHHGHMRMKTFFKGHQTISMEEILHGKGTIGQQSDKCSEHMLESRDLFCNDCKVHICFKCVIVNGHRHHDIIKQSEFEKAIRQRVEELKIQCQTHKTQIEKNIQVIEFQRQEAHTSMQQLEVEIKECYGRKARQMKENQIAQLEKVQSVLKDHDDKLDNMKAQERQRIKHMMSSMHLVTHDRLKHLEAESLAAHSRVCNDLHKFINRSVCNSLNQTEERAIHGSFCPAEWDSISVGRVEVRSIPSPRTDPMYLGFKNTLRIAREVDLRNSVYSMSALSHDTVVIGYGWYSHGTDLCSLSGGRKAHFTEELGAVCDLAFLKDGRMVVSKGKDTIRVYKADGSPTNEQFDCEESSFYWKICIHKDCTVYAVNGTNKIYVFDIGSSLPLSVITNENLHPRQIWVTSSETIITTNRKSSSSLITVYDADGNQGDSIECNDPDQYAYAAVDSADRVWVARVRCKSPMLALSVYNLDETRLVQETTFKEVKLAETELHAWFCCMVCLSPNLLAFASDKKLYFIKVPI